jgi:hypothetical protein
MVKLTHIKLAYEARQVGTKEFFHHIKICLNSRASSQSAAKLFVIAID